MAERKLVKVTFEDDSGIHTEVVPESMLGLPGLEIAMTILKVEPVEGEVKNG